MKPFCVYTAGRVGIFAVLTGLLWVVGLNGLVLFLVALALSLPVSFVVLSRQRAALGQHLERRISERRSDRRRLRSRLRGDGPASGGPGPDRPDWPDQAPR